MSVAAIISTISVLLLLFKKISSCGGKWLLILLQLFATFLYILTLICLLKKLYFLRSMNSC